MNPVFIPPIRVVHVNKNNSVKERISEKRQAMQYSNVYTQWWLWKEQSTKSFLPYMRNKVTQTAKGSETIDVQMDMMDAWRKLQIPLLSFGQ